MAAPIATEPPTLQGAWEAFRQHLPIMLAVIFASSVLSLLGLAVQLAILGILGAPGMNPGPEAAGATTLVAQLAQLPFALLAALVGVLLTVVPALHYETGRTVGVAAAFAFLLQRPRRTVLAGLLFGFAVAIGLFFCLLPGFAVWLVMPVYVNRIFLTDQPISAAFASSFRAVYGTPQGRSFLLLQILCWLAVAAVTLLTCGLGSLLAVPIACFFVQNAAYSHGLVR